MARGALIPRLDASENFSYTNNPVMVFSDLLLQQDFSQKDFALNNLNHPGFLSNFQSQVRLSFPLFAGGRLIAAYRAAGFAADAERWQQIQTRQRVEFAVIQSYYSAVLAEQQVGGGRSGAGRGPRPSKPRRRSLRAWDGRQLRRAANQSAGGQLRTAALPGGKPTPNRVGQPGTYTG